MTKEDLKTIGSVSFFLDSIHRYIGTIQNAENLYIISDCNIHCGLGRNEEAIRIPDCLASELKQKLTEYYSSKYNEYVEKLKKIEL